jgi:hypothetical protein
MRVALFPLIIFLLLNLLLDWYIFHQIDHRSSHARQWKKWLIRLLALIEFVLLIGIIVPARQGNNEVLLTKMWLIFSFGTVFIPKLVALLFDLIAAIPTLFKRKRITPITIAGLILAGVLFLATWWGALINRFNLQDSEVDIEIASLPHSFEGYRIVQFSDLHSGTYNKDTTYVSRLVDHINSLNPDLIVFTGDIVNRRSSEMKPFVSTLSRLHAKDGVIAILGNHDYGDYMTWKTPADKAANMDELYRYYLQTGIRLLRNETEWIHRGSDSIAIIGVENIGDPPFPVYGSLSQAYPALHDNNTKILLSHNPAHWVDSIADNKNMAVDLTLAGHTHAMQIEIAGFSPAVWRYKTWGGLYSDTTNQRPLYVNIGIGTVGMPMRLGATPEVTTFILHHP